MGHYEEATTKWITLNKRERERLTTRVGGRETERKKETETEKSDIDRDGERETETESSRQLWKPMNNTVQ